MSGEIFQPLDALEETEAHLEPLVCRLCNEMYDEPRVLQCYHTFCAQCFRGRAQDGAISCPFCGQNSTLEDSFDLPPEDILMSFLVKSLDEDTACCANCDKISSAMFFCNTCNQPLCPACKEETHKARMFASHKIGTLNNKRTKEHHKKCAVHNEDYIMFSVGKSRLLCIKCFRDLEKEDRADCVDLETAYAQTCQQLTERTSTIQDLQSSVHDAIILFQALTQEVKTNAEEERKAISALYDLMQAKMGETKADLLREVEKQYQEKEKAFKGQLPTLAALLPTLHTTLSICALFSNNANMFEFLDLSASLMERLGAILDHPYQLSPQQSSKICSNFQQEFAKCLQPLLQEAGFNDSFNRNSRCKDSSPYVSHKVARQFSQQATYIQNHRRMVKAAGVRHNVIMGSGPFVEHCKAFEANYKLIHHRIQKMKEQVQELHRDITRRRCLSKKEAVTDILDECSQVQIQIGTQMATLEHMKIVFQRIWQETLERVSQEQGVYQTQLSEMGRLKQETGHLETIAKQITPFINSITAVTHRIDPRRESSDPGFMADSGDSLMAALEQIGTMLPDAPIRAEVIRISEEEREAAVQLAQCKPSQLEDDLIRTKEMLRSHDKSPVLARKGEEDLNTDSEMLRSHDKSPVLSRKGGDLNTDKEMLRSHDKSPVLTKKGEDFNKEMLRSHDKSPVLARKGEDLNTDSEMLRSHDKSPVLSRKGGDLNTDKEMLRSHDKSPVLTKKGEDFNKEMLRSHDKSPVLARKGEELNTDKEMLRSHDKSPVLARKGEELNTDKEMLHSNDKSPVPARKGEELNRDKEMLHSHDKSPVLTKKGEDFNKEMLRSRDKSPVLARNQNKDLNKEQSTFKADVQSELQGNVQWKDELRLDKLESTFPTDTDQDASFDNLSSDCAIENSVAIQEKSQGQQTAFLQADHACQDKKVSPQRFKITVTMDDSKPVMNDNLK